MTHTHTHTHTLVNTTPLYKSFSCKQTKQHHSQHAHKITSKAAHIYPSASFQYRLPLPFSFYHTSKKKQYPKQKGKSPNTHTHTITTTPMSLLSFQTTHATAFQYPTPHTHNNSFPHTSQQQLAHAQTPKPHIQMPIVPFTPILFCHPIKHLPHQYIIITFHHSSTLHICTCWWCSIDWSKKWGKRRKKK